MENMNAGKMTLRSVRLALSPAAALLRQVGEKGGIQPNQKNLDTYLDKIPGQRAAISGFVRYLREVHGAQIALAKANPNRVKLQRRKKLEAELLALMKEGCGSKGFKRRLLSVALAYFHGLKRNVGLVVKDTNLTQADGGLVVTWNNVDYWIPLGFSWDF